MIVPKYAVYLKFSHHRMGVLRNKDQKELFCNQRDVSHYEIIKLDLDEATDNHLEYIREEEANEVWGGYVMFPQEEEYMLLSIDQFMLEIYEVFKEGVNLLQYLKLDEGEETVVNEFLYTCYKKLKIANSDGYGGGEEEDRWDIEYTDYLDMEYMAKYSLRGDLRG